MATNETERFNWPIPAWNADWQKWQEVFGDLIRNIEATVFANMSSAHLIMKQLPVVEIVNMGGGNWVMTMNTDAVFVSRTHLTEIRVPMETVSLTAGAVLGLTFTPGAVGPQDVSWEVFEQGVDVSPEVIPVGYITDAYNIIWYNGAQLLPSTPTQLFGGLGGGGGGGGDRRAAVIDYVDCTAPPPTEVLGDRYILDDTVGAVNPNWDGADKLDIVEFGVGTWAATTPEEGWECYVDAMNKDALFVDDGSPHWEFHAVSGVVDPTGYIFVDADNGSDATGDGSSGNPYQTFAYAASTVAAPGDWATFNTPCTFVISGTHSAAIALPYRREIGIIGGPAIISGTITWNYDIGYWCGNSSTTYVGTLMVRPDVPQSLQIYRIEGKNAVDDTTCGWRRLGIGDSRLCGSLVNLASGNTTNGRQTGELIILLDNCESNFVGNEYIGGVRETAMASDWNNNVLLLTSNSQIQQMVAGCVILFKCVDTFFGDSPDWETNPATGAGSYDGCIGGGSQSQGGIGCRDVEFDSGGIFGWDGATGNPPLPLVLDSNTYDYLVESGVTFNNMTTDFTLVDKARGVAVDESSLAGNLYPATAGDSDTSQKCHNQFDEYLGAGDSTIVVKRGATDLESGANLLAAYTRAAALSPSASNRVLLRIPAGRYDIGSSQWQIDTDYIDIVGFGQAGWTISHTEVIPPTVLITSSDSAATALVDISVDHSSIENIAFDQGSRTGTTVLEFTNDFSRGQMTNIVINVSTAWAAYCTQATMVGNFDRLFTTGTFLPGGDVYSTVRHSKVGNYSFGGAESGGTRACRFYGRAEHVVCGHYCFGASTSQDVGFSGVAIHCDGGQGCFGWTQGAGKTTTVNGRLWNCTTDNEGFGYSAAAGITNLTGAVFEDCRCDGDNAFGYGVTTTLTGAKFYRCRSGNDSFGKGSGACTVDSATYFEDCHAGNDSFGHCSEGHASYSGIAKDCVGGNYCFGSSFSAVAAGQATFAGKAYGCRAGTSSFGYSNATTLDLVFSGEAYDCEAGDYSFCHEHNTRNATLSGKIVRCIGGDNSFCYAEDGSATTSGELRDCEGGNNSFSHSVTNGEGTIGATAVIRNCEGGNYCFAYGGDEAHINVGAVVTDCKAGTDSFGSSPGDVGEIEAHLERCSAGVRSFAAGTAAEVDIKATAVLLDCRAGADSFASTASGEAANIRGRLERCFAGTRSFAYSIVESELRSTAILIDCECTGDYGFASLGSGDAATISGARVVRCKSGDYSFASGTTGTAAITTPSMLEDCESGSYSFGYSSDTTVDLTDAEFHRCLAGDDSFGHGSGNCTVDSNTIFDDCRAGTESFCCSVSGHASYSGTATDCVGGNYCFAASTASAGQTTFAGKTYQCRAGTHSFGSSYTTTTGMTWSGEAHDCEAAENSFCFELGDQTFTFSGAVYNCKAGQHSFAYGGSTASGVVTGEFHNCIGDGEYCFALGLTLTLTGAKFYRCILTGLGGFGIGVTSLSADSDTLFESCEGLLGFVFCGSQLGAATVAATFSNCVGGASSFCVGGAATASVNFSGKAYNCRSGALSFGYSYSTAADNLFSGEVHDCVAGDDSFCSDTGASYSAIFSGTAVNCIGGDRCFGGVKKFTGEAYNCQATSNSFGGDGDDNEGILKGCKCIGRTEGRKMVNGWMEDCLFTKTSGTDGLILVDSASNTPQIYNCTLINNSTYPCVESHDGGGDNVKMAHCRVNADIGPNMTNQIEAGFNALDTDIVAYP